jgi:hypothetical protein
LGDTDGDRSSFVGLADELGLVEPRARLGRRGDVREVVVTTRLVGAATDPSAVPVRIDRP